MPDLFHLAKILVEQARGLLSTFLHLVIFVETCACGVLANVLYYRVCYICLNLR